jgi:ubiquinol-cytochrome c reductase iron-sulfur subunit
MSFVRALNVPITSKMLLGVRQKGAGTLFELLELSGRSSRPVASLFVGGTQARFESTEVDFFKHTKNYVTTGVPRLLDTPAHSGQQEVRFPDFEDYMQEVKKDRSVHARDSEDGRRIKSAMFTIWGGIFTLYLSKQLVRGIVSFKSVTKDQLALASIEIDCSTIPEGKSKTFSWMKKPVFVRHRSQKDIEREAAVDLTELRDPQHDNERAPLNKKWVVVIGVCTHLGCIPIADKGDYGGYYCPCHGSHYDSGGRIRKGPAPLNLEVPEYSFKDENTIVVGGES